eukprot:187555_1
MATQNTPKDDETKEGKKDNDTHEIPITKRKPTEIYRLLPTQHSVVAKSNQWVMIPGLQTTIKVEQDALDVIVTIHCHAACQTSSARVDLSVFIDGEAVGIDGYNKGSIPYDKRHGSGLSHTPTWVPMVSFASITLPPRNNEYIVDCRLMN